MVGILSIRCFLLTMIVAQPVLVSGPTAATAEEVDLSAVTAAAPLTPADLFHLYADRTWVWENGAAYFAKDGRQLRAWTDGANASIGQGRWLVTKNGKLCMDAKWKTLAGSTQGRTCFSHHRLGGTIYQMKDPSGSWYVFQASPAQPAQEYDKFKSGDTTAATFEKMRQMISPGGQPAPVKSGG